jgi:hypothetical protein
VRLFKRIVVVQITNAAGVGRSFTDLHVAFRVDMNMESKPNKGKVTIYNPAPETLALCQAEGAIVRVLVGYEDVAGGVPMLIFQGNPTPNGVKIRKEGPDRICEIEAADGGRAYAEGTVSISYAQPTTLAALMAEALRQLGLPAGSMATLPDRQFPGGFTYEGTARALFDRLAQMAGSRWTIRDGAVQVIARGGSSGEAATVFSAASGNLIGSPAATDKGVAIKGLISPTVRPGKPFRVIAEQLSGDYIAEKVTFDGSNFGGSFYVTVEGNPIGAAA